MKITALRASPLALRFKEPYHWAGRVDYGTVNLLVEVETDEGVSGYGETTASRPAETALTALAGVAPLFEGRSPFDVEGLMRDARFLGGFSHNPRFANLALAGVEMALWDVIGKWAGSPVHQLLGGAYCAAVDYFGFPQGDSAEELAADASRLAAEGYSVIYMKVGRGERKDIENTRAVREAIGDRKLRLDANEAWDVRTALYMIRRLAEFEPEFVEQPTSAQSIAALKQVRDASPVAIAADQSVYSLHDVYEVCRQQAADLIVLSFHEAGGLLAFKKAAAIAEAAGIGVCLHGQSVTGMSDLAQHQIALTLPNLADGNQIMHQLLVEDIIAAPDLTPVEGKLPASIATRAGLGFELNPDAVARARELYETDTTFHHS
jgi:L-alanine-DL-glutamate epimerase-like enolase superfamily enzyme